MTKKFSLLFLICILGALNIYATVYEGLCGDNVNYSLDTSTGVLSITGTGEMTNYSYYSSVPWYNKMSYIKTVEISNGVTSIGNFAFYGCTGLTSIIIPNSVTTIGNYALYNCSSLTSITIPNSVTSIGYGAFFNCSGLTSVTIPISVTSIIGDNAFSGCYFEKKDFINNSSLDVEANNFWGANIVDSRDNGFVIKDDVLIKYLGNETSVTIPNSVTSIGINVFYGCSGLTSIEIPNSVTSIGNGAFSNCSGLTSIIIPNSVTSIGNSAFMSCTALTSVTIPNSVTIIGNGAFLDTPWYNTWYNNQPDGLVYIGKVCYAYKGTIPANTSISLKAGTTSIGDGAFSSCTGLTSITIPSSVTSIGSSAFSNCTGLTSITIPNSVTSIGHSAFWNCTGLTSVTIPNSVTTIEGYVFNNCDDLIQVTINSDAVASKQLLREIMGRQVKEYIIGNDVKTIGENAFRLCTDLTSIKIGSDVESIGDKAFAENPKLERIVCYAKNVPTTSRNAFENSYIDYINLYVPASSIDAYKSTAPWKNAAQILPLEDIKEKCATPTILFENGKLSFICETEGVKYVYNFSTPSESDEDGKGINMPNKLQVSVYAKKDGYENSDVATKEIDLGTSGLRGDVNNDGQVGMPDAMFIVNKILNGKFPDEK